MRKSIFCVLCFGFALTQASAAFAAYKASEFFKDCNSAIAITRGDKGRAAELSGALHCLGFVEGAAEGMRRSHELYGFLFPRLKQDDLKSDIIGKRYIATSLLAGMDICIPKTTTLQILLLLIVKNINDDPTTLSLTPWLIVNTALANTYGCHYDGTDPIE